MTITMYDKLLQLPPFLQGMCTEDFTNILEKVKLPLPQIRTGKNAHLLKMKNVTSSFSS